VGKTVWFGGPAANVRPRTRGYDRRRDHGRAKRLTDLLDSIRVQLQTRLDELRPLVREYEQLQEAALADGAPTGAALAGQPKRGGTRARQSDGRRGGPSRTGSRRRSSSPAEREANRVKVLTLVHERPGITKPELQIRPVSPAPASRRTCGGWSTAARCARKPCRAMRPATGSLTTKPRRARAGARARPAGKPDACPGARRPGNRCAEACLETRRRNACVGAASGVCLTDVR
jgi:hypothetical protein